MYTQNFWKRPLLTLLALAGLSIGLANGGAGLLATDAEAASTGTLKLAAPSFVGAAASAGESIQSVISDEATIAAYFQAPAAVDLNAIRTIYHVIETETSDYLLGTVRIAEYLEDYNIHLYVHKSGWFLAYLTDGPTSKIVDMKAYAADEFVLTTILEDVLSIAAGEAGIPFPGAIHYHFGYPNATHMMIVAEIYSTGDGFFEIELPSTYSFFERSWIIYDSSDFYGMTLRLDDSTVTTTSSSHVGVVWSTFSAAQLALDTKHKFSIDDYYGALVLVYQVP